MPKYEAGRLSILPSPWRICMRQITSRQAKRWLWVSLLALVALPTYYVREILACLFLFSVLFLLSTAGLAVLALAGAGITRLLSGFVSCSLSSVSSFRLHPLRPQHKGAVQVPCSKQVGRLLPLLRAHGFARPSTDLIVAPSNSATS